MRRAKWRTWWVDICYISIPQAPANRSTRLAPRAPSSSSSCMKFPFDLCFALVPLPPSPPSSFIAVSHADHTRRAQQRTWMLTVRGWTGEEPATKDIRLCIDLCRWVRNTMTELDSTSMIEFHPLGLFHRFRHIVPDHPERMVVPCGLRTSY